MLYKILLGRDNLSIKENPAAHLHDILTEVYLTSAENPYNTQFSTTWAKALEVDDENLDDILEGVISTQDLYRQTRNIVKKHKELNLDENNNQLDKIEKALYTLNLQGDMAIFHANVKSETLLSLWYIASLIEILIKVPKTLLSEEERNVLQSQIHKLIEDFMESDLPADLKSACTNNLLNINTSLMHYRIHGAKGLHESIAKAAGEVILNPSVNEHKDNKDIINLFEIIQRINMMVTTSETVIKLSTAVNKLIP